MFGEDDPVGRTMYMGGRVVSVVGVGSDVRHWGLTQRVENDVYAPYAGMGDRAHRLYVALRTTAPPDIMVEQVRDAIWAVEPNVP